MAAVATNMQLYTQSIFMGIFFVIFSGSAWVFIGKWGWGGSGVVAANVVNMGLRIIWNVYFVKNFFVEKEVVFNIKNALPSSFSTIAATLVPYLLNARLTNGYLERYGILGELLSVGVVGVVLVSHIGIVERKFLKECWVMIKHGRSQ